MATIRIETTIDAAPEDVWDALRDFGALHTRLAPGFAVDQYRTGGLFDAVKQLNGLTPAPV